MEKLIQSITEESLEKLNVKQLLQLSVELNDYLVQHSSDHKVVEMVSDLHYDIICEISNKLGI